MPILIDSASSYQIPEKRIPCLQSSSLPRLRIRFYECDLIHPRMRKLSPSLLRPWAYILSLTTTPSLLQLFLPVLGFHTRCCTLPGAHFKQYWKTIWKSLQRLGGVHGVLATLPQIPMGGKSQKEEEEEKKKERFWLWTCTLLGGTKKSRRRRRVSHLSSHSFRVRWHSRLWQAVSRTMPSTLELLDSLMYSPISHSKSGIAVSEVTNNINQWMHDDLTPKFLKHLAISRENCPKINPIC